jgi:NADH-quinone oxidoreductase subunit L
VIIGMHHNQDIRWMGNVRKYMPVTYWTSLVGSLALIGTPFFAGFYSKDSIIEAVHASTLPGHGFAVFAVTAGVFVTAFYSFRMFFLVFHGKERFDQNPDAHHQHFSDEEPDHGHHDDHHEPHESPWVVTAPLILLAIPSVLAGYLWINGMLYSDFLKDSIFVNPEAHKAMESLAEEFHGPLQMALHGFMAAPFWLSLAGVVCAWYFYLKNPAIPAAIKQRFNWLYTILDNKYYFDWFNENVLARGARLVGTGLWKGGDQAVIDGAAVNGSARLVAWFAGVIRWVQTGYLFHYAFAMIIGVFVLMTWFVWLHR